MFAAGPSLSPTNRQTAMTFSLIPIAHHNQFQPLSTQPSLDFFFPHKLYHYLTDYISRNKDFVMDGIK
jgi:hypothetical protein